MRKLRSLIAAPLIIASVSIPAQSTVETRLIGVRIRVSNISKAKDFYLGTLGFRVKSESSDKRSILLDTDDYQVVLEESKAARPITTPGYGNISMSMQVNDIDATFRKLKSANVRFITDSKRKEGVGWSLQVLDPFGNKISMMQITVGGRETVKEPAVYNCGLYVTDIERELSTYQDVLGFRVRSRAYMPEDMPLGTSDGKFAFMLHLRRPEFVHVENPNMLLIFGVKGEGAMKILKGSGLKIKKGRYNSVYMIEDALGIRSEVQVE